MAMIVAVTVLWDVIIRILLCSNISIWMRTQSLILLYPPPRHSLSWVPPSSLSHLLICPLLTPHFIISHHITTHHFTSDVISQFCISCSLLKDEMMKLRSAIDGNRVYDIPERHDPLYLMFDNSFHLGDRSDTLSPPFLCLRRRVKVGLQHSLASFPHLLSSPLLSPLFLLITPLLSPTGTATHWPEYLCYNLETDEVSGQTLARLSGRYIPIRKEIEVQQC